ncbi:MAG: MgtC/SapB family protein [Firmicutes bacterium]|nr:MgtC/SapB family protein [Bacillota bacterium]
MAGDLSGPILFKLLCAFLLGGVIGLERELREKPAGLRTNMFICIGATLYTILSFEMARRYGGDPVRIAAQLIPGIGFIGAGAILRERGGVVGITTAATIFVNASVGMAIGAGLYFTAAATAGLALFVLWAVGRVERWIGKHKKQNDV